MAKIDLPQVETHLYINGKWLEGSEGTFEVKNPATGEILATVQKGGEKETKEAIQAANKAFEGWSKTSPAERNHDDGTRKTAKSSSSGNPNECGESSVECGGRTAYCRGHRSFTNY